MKLPRRLLAVVPFLRRREADPAAQLAKHVARPRTRTLAQMRWRQAYECGHPVIDGQHRQLFDIGDRLIDAVQRAHARERIESLLAELVEHIEEHFRTEEAVLARTGYPLSDEHLSIHDGLLQQAASLSGRYHERTVEAEELVSFVANDVVAAHIIQEDLKFALQG